MRINAELMLLVFLIAASAAVTASHARMLRQGQAAAASPREARERLWRRHLHVNGTLWVLVFLAVLTEEYILLVSPIAYLQTPHPAFGLVLGAAGLILVIWSRLILGRAGAMGIRWFLPEAAGVWEARGPYKYLANPMYDGFILIFLALGFGLGIPENFVLALASFLLLNVYLAQVESRGEKYRIF